MDAADERAFRLVRNDCSSWPILPKNFSNTTEAPVITEFQQNCKISIRFSWSLPAVPILAFHSRETNWIKGALWSNITLESAIFSPSQLKLAITIKLRVKWYQLRLFNERGFNCHYANDEHFLMEVLAVFSSHALVHSLLSGSLWAQGVSQSFSTFFTPGASSPGSLSRSVCIPAERSSFLCTCTSERVVLKVFSVHWYDRKHTDGRKT